MANYDVNIRGTLHVEASDAEEAFQRATTLLNSEHIDHEITDVREVEPQDDGED